MCRTPAPLPLNVTPQHRPNLSSVALPSLYNVVLLSAQWGGSNGIEAQSLGPLFLQCFDTVGWVF